LRLHDDGSLRKEFVGNTVDHALQTVLDDRALEDPRYAERGPAALEVEFPVGCPVFFLGAVPYGAFASVEGHTNGMLSVKLPRSTLDAAAETRLSAQTRGVAQDCERRERYVASYHAAREAGISPVVVSRLASSLLVASHRADQRANIGLSLKFDGRAKRVLGYSRKAQNGWEYSAKAVELLKEYKRRFPEVIAGLERRSKADLFQESDFFEPEVVSQRMGELRDWLKSIGTRDFERVDLDTRALTKEFVQEIEAVVQRMRSEAAPAAGKARLVNGVPRQAVLKPVHAAHRLSGQSFDLGDRVVHAADAGSSVPVGARGTVVAVSARLIDVVFDDAFMGGGSLSGRCTDGHGIQLPRGAILNLSNPQVSASPAAATSATGGSVGATVPLRIAGQPLMSPTQRQYHANPASVPAAAPPARPAWGGAGASSTAGGGRGRGAMQGHQPSSATPPPRIQQRQQQPQQAERLQGTGWHSSAGASDSSSTPQHGPSPSPPPGAWGGGAAAAWRDNGNNSGGAGTGRTQNRPRSAAAEYPPVAGSPQEPDARLAIESNLKTMLKIGGAAAPLQVARRPEDVATESLRSMLGIQAAAVTTPAPEAQATESLKAMLRIGTPEPGAGRGRPPSTTPSDTAGSGSGGGGGGWRNGQEQTEQQQGWWNAADDGGGTGGAGPQRWTPPPQQQGVSPRRASDSAAQGGGGGGGGGGHRRVRYRKSSFEHRRQDELM
ncbi:hypothetical protein HK405_011534, partial [Cladochytrium tenue]